MKVKKPAARDPKKERIFRELSAVLERRGHTVRREELKRGHGWTVVSGSCRLKGDPILFVDRRMTIEDQLSFLTGKILSLSITLTDEEQNALTEAGWTFEAPRAA